MSSLKDLERTTRLCEKEIDALADQFAQKESLLRLDVDHLRLELEALTRCLAERDPPFLDNYRRTKGQILRELGEAVEK